LYLKSKKPIGKKRIFIFKLKSKGDDIDKILKMDLKYPNYKIFNPQELELAFDELEIKNTKRLILKLEES